MTANFKPIFELTPINAGVEFTDADTTDIKTIVTAGADGSRIDGILVSSNDTVAVNLAFHIDDGADVYYIGNVNVPIGSGYTTVVRVDAMTTLQPANQTFLQLKAGYILKCNCVATMTTAGRVTTVVAIGGDF